MFSPSKNVCPASTKPEEASSFIEYIYPSSAAASITDPPSVTSTNKDPEGRSFTVAVEDVPFSLRIFPSV